MLPGIHRGGRGRRAALLPSAVLPIVPRGAGTGYTGGAVPMRGGVVLSLERMNRILEIDEANLRRGRRSRTSSPAICRTPSTKSACSIRRTRRRCGSRSIGGNVAECAGGPRAFKYGTTKRYVLGLEAVLPTGEIIQTGGKAVKNVVGYDLTQLLVGSEGTLAIITKIILRLVPQPPVQATLRATFPDVESAVAAVTNIIRARVVPAALELIDGDSLEAVARNLERPLARAGRHRGDAAPRSGRRAGGGARKRRRGRAGLPRSGSDRSAARPRRCGAPGAVARPARALAVAEDDRAAQVQPRRGRAEGPDSGAVRAGRSASGRSSGCRFRCSVTPATATSTSTSWWTPDDADEIARAHVAERVLFEGVVALEGSISGEHGIGFAKAPFLRDRAVGRRDRADEARQAGVRSRTAS